MCDLRKKTSHFSDYSSLPTAWIFCFSTIYSVENRSMTEHAFSYESLSLSLSLSFSVRVRACVIGKL
jgi:hypothetical protein